MANDIAPINLRPAASPVDTYTGASRSSLRDFAEGLAKLDGPLNEFINHRAEEFKREEAIRGEAAFHANNSEDYAEAVRKGLIPAQSSKTFMRSYKLAQGTLAGQQLSTKFATAYNAWDGKYSEDPKAFDKFMSDFVKENVGTDDPDILAGVMPQVRQLTANAQAKHTADLSETVYKGNLDASVANANADIEEANKDGLASGAGTDYPALFTKIGERRDAFIKGGGDPTDFDKAMVDAMSAKILSTRDPALLAFFDQKVPGTDYTYGNSPYGQKVKEDTVNALEVIQRRNQSDEAEKTKAQDKAMKEDAERKAIEILAADPSAEIPEDILSQGMKYDPKFKVNLTAWRKSLAEGIPDPERIDGVYAAIAAGGGTKAVIDAMNQGAFAGDPEGFTKAYNFAKGFEDNKSRIDTVEQGSTYKNITRALDIRTSSQTDLLNPLKGMSNEGFEATYDFDRAVKQWVIAHPDATELEIQDAVTKIGKSIMDAIQPPNGVTGAAGVYSRPENAPFDNPYTDAPAPTQEVPPAAAPEVTPKAEPGPGPSFPDFIPDGVTGGGVTVPSSDVTPEQSKAIDDLAKTRGVPREQIMKEMGLQPASYAPEADNTEPQGGDRREAEFTQEQAAQFLEQAMASSTEDGAASIEGDAVAGQLSHLVGQHESGGNYNAVYGNSKSQVALSKFTVDDILGMQTAAIRRGSPSSAIGKYQIIRGTLRGLKKEMGLTGGEKFTKKLQDRMFLHLLNRRGYQAFKAGKLSKRQFALRLAQEWASLPDPNTGMSYYASDGLNRSSVRSTQVYAALGLGSA